MRPAPAEDRAPFVNTAGGLRVLVTGAAGFVGRALCEALARAGHRVVPAVRSHASAPDAVALGDIGPATDWGPVLSGCDGVVHLAARVHAAPVNGGGDVSAYRRVNTEATLNLARQAAHAGVKRLVFVSTIKVNGEARVGPCRETDVEAPVGAYAVSKWEAELGLRRIARETGLEIAVLRPPLVYGPGVRANFLQLMRAIERGWPLPLGAIRNQRSLLYLGNFTDALRVCLEHPGAAGRTFLLDDGKAVSTPELIRALARAMGRPARLFPVPPWLLRATSRPFGGAARLSRLTDSLYVDASAIRSQLDWLPPHSMAEGLAATVAAHA
jgi:UDP-glucose 4-epimerase